MAYDPVNDVAPISLIANVASVLVAHPSLPVKNIKELIALAKARPGQLNFASGSSVYQLCGELLKITAKIDLTHVPYKGGSQAITDILGGQIDLMFTGDAGHAAAYQVRQTESARGHQLQTRGRAA